MCIRDSLNLKRLRRIAGDKAVELRLVSRDARTRALAREAGCLLYTSDAADDLLCVALGGRRII